MVKNCVGTLSSVQIGESKFDYLASSEVVSYCLKDPVLLGSKLMWPRSTGHGPCNCLGVPVYHLGRLTDSGVEGVLAHLSDRRRGNFLLSISYFAFKLLEFLL